MKTELDNKYYDNAYLSSDKYSKHYRDVPYQKLWEHILTLLDKDSIVADFGCGTGQFAHMLIDNDINYAYGVDFSEVAVNKAVVTVEANFYQADLYDLTTYMKHDYNTAIILETLEHMEDDKAFFHKLPADTRIILTVPDFDSVSHVRYFPEIQDVRDRYKGLMRISGGKTFMLGKKQIHLIYGRKI